MKLILTTIAAIASFVFSASARAEWWVAESSHFVVYSDTNKKDAEDFARRLERLDSAMRIMQNMPPDEGKKGTRLTVYQYGRVSDIATLAGAPGSGIAGFYIPRSSGSNAFVPARKERDDSLGVKSDPSFSLDGERILFHEYAHHFMMQYFAAAYPAWYIEGFAEVYGVLNLNDNGSFQLGAPAKHRAMQLIHDEPFPVRKLFLPTKELEPGDNRFFYSTGWLLVHYLTFSGERPGQLKKYLDLMNQGKSSMDAAKEAFGDLGKLDSDLVKYQNSRLKGMVVTPPNYVAPTIVMRPATEGEAAILKVKMRSKVGVTEKSAPDVADEARKIAAKFPNDPFVQTALAEAEFDAKNLDAASDAADRALAADPNWREALIFKGLIAMKRAETDPTQYAVARKFFSAAYNLDNSFPDALIQNYLSYYKEGTNIPKNAIIGLESAFVLAPFDPEVRLILGRQLLNENNSDAAKVVMMPVANSAHESGTSKRTRKVIDLIDSGNTEEAGSLLSRMIAGEKFPEDKNS